MKKIVPALFLFILSSIIAFAQKEANIWYFGFRAGLDFNSGSPIPLTNGKSVTYEGSATFSDKTTGQLLFYTDGDTLYNRNHTIMPNGAGLLGNKSSTQSAVVIPMPGSSTKYYLFTVDAQAGLIPPSTTGFGGLAYSIVDMTLNGGLGDLSVKNLSLVTKTTEKLTAVRHCNGRDIWVMAHLWNSNAFYGYLVTPTGINPPVITNIGIVHADIGSTKNKEAIGYMKFSTDARKLASVSYFNQNTLQIFDFDNNTGIVSNPITDSAFPPNLSGSDGTYGVAFSPDNSRLYVSYFGYQASPSYMYQYNMLAGNAAAIISSKTQIISEPNNGLGGIQIGPDGKMYVAKFDKLNPNGLSNYLDVINNPNALGTACNYSFNGIYLGGAGVNQSGLGLPDIVESFLIPHYAGTLSYTTCTGNQTLTFTDTTLNGTISVLWNFGDPGSGASNTSNLQNPTHAFSTSGSFTVTAYFSNACKTDTFVQTIVVGGGLTATISPDTSICSIDYAQLRAGGGTTYHWSPGTGLSDSTVAEPFAVPSATTTYTVTVSSGGCSATKTVTVTVTQSPPTPNITIGHDTLYCSYNSSYTSYQWYSNTSLIPGATNSYYVISQSGNYNVSVSNEDGCSIAVGINVVLGVRNLMQQSILLSPNPARDQFTVYGLQFTSGQTKMDIYNILGEMVYSKQLETVTREGKAVIDINGFSKGVYFVRIQQAKEVWTGKFFKD